jgi:hypothetical protein
MVISAISITLGQTQPEEKPKKELVKQIRKGGQGSMYNSAYCQQINQMCDEIGVSGDELCEMLLEKDKTPITRLSLQSYKQGNVLDKEAYLNLIKRIEPILEERRSKYGHLMQRNAVTIINDWMKLLQIDMKDAKKSPWKAFSSMIGIVDREVIQNDEKVTVKVTIDPTTMYRWYKYDKKPSSINDLIWYDNVVKSTAKKRAKKGVSA